MDGVPEKPSAMVMALEGRKFVSLKVDYRQTGADTAETYWVLTDWDGRTSEYREESVRSLLDVSPDFNSVARLKDGCQLRAEAWKAWEKRHAKDIAELKRLERKIYGKEKANGGG